MSDSYWTKRRKIEATVENDIANIMYVNIVSDNIPILSDQIVVILLVL